MSVTTGRRAFRSFAALALVAGSVVAGCGGGTRTSVTQVWSAPVTRPMKTMLVFGARMDEASRRVLEDSIVKELGWHNVTATPSYALFQGPAPARETARELVKQAGFDGLLVATMKSVSERTTVLPGSYQTGFWSSYYGQSMGTYDEPGHALTDTVVNFETTLWDARAQDALVWTATLATTSPSSGPGFAKSLTRTIVTSLEKAELFPPTSYTR